VLVVEVLGALLGLVLGLLAVPSILAFGLGETVNLTTGETGDHLLGELVVDWLACVVVSAWFCEAGTSILLTLLALLVFEHLHRHEWSAASYELVAELGLVSTAIVVIVDLVVVVLSFAESEHFDG
jgi:hypothetical protein